MLGRYRIVRGKRSPEDPLPDGVRQDTRKHTRHVLRPNPDDVAAFLADTSAAGWRRFSAAYRTELRRRRDADAEPFDALAELARTRDVWLGCNCPTRKNPDVRRCHTFLALEFMAERYADLVVEWP